MVGGLRCSRSVSEPDSFVLKEKMPMSQDINEFLGCLEVLVSSPEVSLSDECLVAIDAAMDELLQLFDPTNNDAEAKIKAYRIQTRLTLHPELSAYRVSAGAMIIRPAEEKRPNQTPVSGAPQQSGGVNMIVDPRSRAKSIQDKIKKTRSQSPNDPPHK